MNFINELNSSQQEAVINTEGPSLVIAGAGSGKTRVLTYRIAQLLSQGVPAYKILALTFTNKAAREMQKRIAELVGQEIAANLWMGTFHSIFSKILRFEAEKLGYTSSYTIYDTQDSKNMIKAIVKDMKLDDKIYKPSTILGRISMAKNNLIVAQSYAQSSRILSEDTAGKRPLLGEIYKQYQQRCKQSDTMDFDDLLLQTNILFRDFPDILAKYQQKFNYILVDEYQDTNYAQYLIVKKLSDRHHNICVVGDDAQSIYSFRGARIENILNFKNDYPEYKLYKLEQNYRSTTTIVDAANCVISKNKEQIPKKTFSQNEEGEKIKVLRALSDKEEGFQVTNEIFRLANYEQQEYSDFAILYRTNAQSRILEEALRKRNIPYKIYGGQSFYQRKEIKDLLAYFRLTVNQNDEEAFKRIINYPRRGIGDSTVDKIREIAGKYHVSLWTVLCNLDKVAGAFNSGTLSKLQKFGSLIERFREQIANENAYDAAVIIARSSGIIDDLSNDETPEGVSRKENIQELLNGIKDFSETAYKEGKDDKLPAFLEGVALLTDQDGDKEGDQNKVTLMTIHASKGLEFSNVFITGLEEELFPAQQCMTTPAALEEERRLFYVALTRAEKRAFMSFATSRYKNGQVVSSRPSRFIGEIDQEFLEGYIAMREAEFISGILNDAIPDDTTLLLNADDLISGRIKPGNRRVYFGIDPLADEPQQRGSIIQDLRSCPACGAPIQFSFQRYHHIGRVQCPCGFTSPAPDYAVSAVAYDAARLTVRSGGGEEQYHLVNNSIFNIYNEVAVIALLRVLGMDPAHIRASMEKIKITDTRYVEQYAGGVKLVAHIAKGQNPIACSRVFDYVSREPGRKIVFIMIDDIYDNRDTSENLTWIYETDFEFLNREGIEHIYVAGPRSQDYRLRMLLAGIPDGRITAFRHEKDFVKVADLSGADSVYILYELFQYDLAMKLKDETAAALEALAAAEDGGEPA